MLATHKGVVFWEHTNHCLLKISDCLSNTFPVWCELLTNPYKEEEEEVTYKTCSPPCHILPCPLSPPLQPHWPPSFPETPEVYSSLKPFTLCPQAFSLLGCPKDKFSSSFRIQFNNPLLRKTFPGDLRSFNTPIVFFLSFFFF